VTAAGKYQYINLLGETSIRAKETFHRLCDSHDGMALYGPTDDDWYVRCVVDFTVSWWMSVTSLVEAVVSRGSSDMGCTDTSHLRIKSPRSPGVLLGVYTKRHGAGPRMPSGKVHRYVTVASTILDIDSEVTTSFLICDVVS